MVDTAESLLRVADSAYLMTSRLTMGRGSIDSEMTNTDPRTGVSTRRMLCIFYLWMNPEGILLPYKASLAFVPTGALRTPRYSIESKTVIAVLIQLCPELIAQANRTRHRLHVQNWVVSRPTSTGELLRVLVHLSRSNYHHTPQVRRQFLRLTRNVCKS